MKGKSVLPFSFLTDISDVIRRLLIDIIIKPIGENQCGITSPGNDRIVSVIIVREIILRFLGIQTYLNL